MKLLSVNVAAPRPTSAGKPGQLTGIYKEPAQGPVTIAAEGLAGDAICNTKVHGGPDQAVYLYGQPDYAWWSQHLDRPLMPGMFGENLTIDGMVSHEMAIGDRLHVGESVVLEVTAPRIPCGVFAERMGDADIIKKFIAAERPGVYCRVIRTGAVTAGDAITLRPYAGDRVTARDVFREYFNAPHDEVTVRRHLAVPLASRTREDHERYLRALPAR